jgi:hypothetical protein
METRTGFRRIEIARGLHSIYYICSSGIHLARLKILVSADRIDITVRDKLYFSENLTFLSTNGRHVSTDIKLTVKNGVFWDVTPCGSCKNRRYGGT